MYTIIETKTKLEKKAGTKNAYREVSKEVTEVTKRQHELTTNDDTCKWFRRLGGSESATRGYTCAGYVVVKLVSTSPDRESKTVREYKFTNTPKKESTTTFENLSLYGKIQRLQSKNLYSDALRNDMQTYEGGQMAFETLHEKFNQANK